MSKTAHSCPTSVLRMLMSRPCKTISPWHVFRDQASTAICCCLCYKKQLIINDSVRSSVERKQKSAPLSVMTGASVLERQPSSVTDKC